jgi:hypothetical protein
MNVVRKVGLTISACVGFLLGAIFTTINMVKMGNVIPIGILISALSSMIISAIVGFIVPMRDIADGLAEKLKINPSQQRFLYNLVQGIVGDLIFTPILCTFFVIKNVGIHNPMILQILGMNLLIDFLVALPLTMIFVPLFKKLASALFHVSSDSIT